MCIENILKLLHHFIDLLSFEKKDFLIFNRKDKQLISLTEVT